MRLRNIQLGEAGHMGLAGWQGGCEDGVESCRYACKTSQTLDEQMWSQLPGEIVERVLLRLPFPSRVATQTVCKRRDRHILSGRCISVSPSDLPREKSWLFTYGPKVTDALQAFDPVLDQWCNVPLTFIPRSLGKGFSNNEQIGWNCCAAAGGLLVLQYQLHGGFCVCNPITKSWRRLPRSIHKRVSPVVSLVIDANGKGYSLVVAGGDELLTTEVYMSKTNRWRKTCGTPVLGNWEAMRSSSAVCKGVLYHMIHPFNEILAYDTRLGHWQLMKMSLPTAMVSKYSPEIVHVNGVRRTPLELAQHRYDAVSPFLVESKGRLLMVGFLDSEKGSRLWGVGIWELQFAQMEWVKITVMPDAIFKNLRLNFSEYFEFRGAGHGDHVYIFQVSNSPVIACDLSIDPPLWKCIHNGLVQDESWPVHGCAVDLRLDALI